MGSEKVGARPPIFFQSYLVIVYAKVGGHTKCIMGDVEVHNVLKDITNSLKSLELVEGEK